MSDNKNKISGWYYDLQANNTLLRISLHPNRVLKEDGVTWEDVKDGTDEANGNETYREKPLCTAITTEDFSVSVANNWSDFGGDMLGQAWESVKNLAPYASNLEEALKRADAQYKSIKDTEQGKDIKESRLSNLMAKGVSWMVDDIDRRKANGNSSISEYLNRSLVVQGTRFSYYSGSGTSFSNLTMKFLVFPKWEDKTFITVNNQIEELLPYCIGKYVNFRGEDPNKKEQNKGNSDDKDLIDLDKMIGWQKPPGGFEAYYENVDTVQKGTLLLIVP